ncbi:hypothetical protein [Herbiconiux sp. A18JL235]|uniref:DUF2207 domain-containing protein n=1 Tax=Herbiconiux sp. A18JL235 TaxID=3152363 RepID=A0AB39BF97_9MICO
MGGAIVVLGIAAGLVLVALVLRMALRRSPRDAVPQVEPFQPSPALVDALLADRDRRAAAAALTDLDSRGAIALLRPAKGSAPAVQVLDAALLSDDERDLVTAYSGASIGDSKAEGGSAPSRWRDAQRDRLFDAVSAASWSLWERDLTRIPFRWPSLLLVALALLGVAAGIVCGVLVAPDAAPLAVSGVAVVVFAAVIAVAPVRCRRPRAIADGRRVELARIRSVVAADGAGALATGVSLAHLALFGSPSQLAGVTVGRDAVALSALVRASDYGAERWRLIYAFIDFASLFNRA